MTNWKKKPCGWHFLLVKISKLSLTKYIYYIYSIRVYIYMPPYFLCFWLCFHSCIGEWRKRNTMFFLSRLNYCDRYIWTTLGKKRVERDGMIDALFFMFFMQTSPSIYSHQMIITASLDTASIFARRFRYYAV